MADIKVQTECKEKPKKQSKSSYKNGNKTSLCLQAKDEMGQNMKTHLLITKDVLELSQ